MDCFDTFISFWVHRCNIAPTGPLFDFLLSGIDGTGGKNADAGVSGAPGRTGNAGVGTIGARDPDAVDSDLN